MVLIHVTTLDWQPSGSCISTESVRCTNHVWLKNADPALSVYKDWSGTHCLCFHTEIPEPGTCCFCGAVSDWWAYIEPIPPNFADDPADKAKYDAYRAEMRAERGSPV